MLAGRLILKVVVAASAAGGGYLYSNNSSNNQSLSNASNHVPSRSLISNGRTSNKSNDLITTPPVPVAVPVPVAAPVAAPVAVPVPPQPDPSSLKVYNDLRPVNQTIKYNNAMLFRPVLPGALLATTSSGMSSFFSWDSLRRYFSSESSSEDAESMQERIKKFKMIEKRVKPDGNCQFRSLADQVHQDENKHDDVRDQVVGWLQSNESYQVEQAKLEDFLDRDLFPTWKTYCEHMKRSGSWGDQMTLLAAAEVYNAEIWILSSMKFPPGIDPVITIRPSRNPIQKQIRLAHYHELHYNSLYPHPNQV